MRKILSKLKNQKGATGTDILISAAVIVLSIGVVSMMYVNTSIQSRNLTRTSGANRIATNLIENIDVMSYDDFVSWLKATPTTNWNEATEKLDITNTTIFSTKIPTGYKVDITATPVYGSHSDPAAVADQFDLVRQVEVKVRYNVGNVEENVTFSTVKQRELIKECNEPATGDLRTQLQAGMNYYPVKYMQSAKAYIKTTEDDPEWYNYSTKNWATVIVSKVDESSLFDLNGKFIGTINTTTTDPKYTQKFVWVPAFYTTAVSNTVFNSFAYRMPSESKIVKESTLNSIGGTTFKYYTFDNKTSADFYNPDWGAVTGIWSGVTATNTFSSTFANGLNSNNVYGPCNIH